MLRGCREIAGEIGHIVMQIGGPLCACGNRGCFEALASRSAIERDIRQAIAGGRKSLIAEWLEDRHTAVRSKMLRRALKAEDAVVTEVMRQAAETIGYACLTIRHVLDPEIIVLGGGLMQSSPIFLPEVIKMVHKMAWTYPRKKVKIKAALLGKKAAALGIVFHSQLKDI